MLKENLIIDIAKNSIAEKIGIQPGDKLLAINQSIVKDVLDYMFLVTDEEITLDVKKSDGRIVRYKISKDYDDDLGLIFEDGLMDKPRVCKNKCMFCFVDQMPKNMRKSLYVKDDDYRLSFLYGNFITLTNVSEKEIRRIINMKLSPLYVSVHATDDNVRVALMANPKAKGIMDKLTTLVNGGINLHCQLVMVRGVNDGKVLDRSIEDLVSLFPGVISIAAVPVGLTAYREGLAPITPWDGPSSREIIEQIEGWGKRLKEQFGTPLVYASDEFYVMADREVPDAEYYEGFPQIENGVGLIAKLKDEFYSSLSKYRGITPKSKKVSIATGISAYKFIKSLANQIMDNFEIEIAVYAIKNNFFGPSVTVAGLLTGSDLISQLKDKDLGQRLIIPDVMLKEGEDIFLDDKTLDDVKDALGVEVVVSAVNGEDLIKKVIGEI
ncbi:putative radical SAM enzyme, TIGR03279 family [Caldanaerobius fijiensis DSM 17918]|uniref:Putative radical SAM enzyme, TIGR03279 family n=1 Tax=Caldanaerobius fijiensis DSM 17918 TaxID=1121256 RepID=A0A1M4SZV4_9THEO|nr:DUF512 domain-containing protein [Caldanaerobius fijiensis]SHE37735.1 putative radical SAM enzyme, TIGR03279 family [Caldanaerobius fijiensis DSM 17918]